VAETVARFNDKRTIVFERALVTAIFVADAAHGMQDTIDCTFLYLGYCPLLRPT